MTKQDDDMESLRVRAEAAEEQRDHMHDCWMRCSEDLGFYVRELAASKAECERLRAVLEDVPRPWGIDAALAGDPATCCWPHAADHDVHHSQCPEVVDRGAFAEPPTCKLTLQVEPPITRKQVEDRSDPPPGYRVWSDIYPPKFCGSWGAGADLGDNEHEYRANAVAACWGHLDVVCAQVEREIADYVESNWCAPAEMAVRIRSGAYRKDGK